MKLKWEILQNDLRLIYMSKYLTNINYLKFFKLNENNLINIFGNSFVLFKITKIYEENKIKPNIFYINSFDFNFLNNNEEIIKIKQNNNDFLAFTNLKNLFIFSISNYDFYVDVKIKEKIDYNKKIRFFNFQKNFFVLKDDNLYLYKYNNNKISYLIFNLDISLETIINIYFIEKDNRYVFFTNDKIFIFNSMNFSKNYIFEENKNYKGYFFNDKIFYIKNDDEFCVYDIYNTKNNFSLQFNSKKIINKINFNKILFANDEIVLLINKSKVELYCYKFTTGQFNRENILYKNKKFVIFDNFIFILNFNINNLEIKGKYLLYNNEIKQNNNLSNKNINFFLFNLKQIEKQYENEYKYNNKIENYQTNIIKTIKNKMNKNNFNIIKKIINIYLHKIYNLLLKNNSIKIFENIYFKIKNNYNFYHRIIFNDNILLLNYKNIYLIYLINISIDIINKLKIIIKNTHDLDSENKINKIYNFLY